MSSSRGQRDARRGLAVAHVRDQERRASSCSGPTHSSPTSTARRFRWPWAGALGAQRAQGPTRTRRAQVSTRPIRGPSPSSRSRRGRIHAALVGEGLLRHARHRVGGAAHLGVAAIRTRHQYLTGAHGRAPFNRSSRQPTALLRCGTAGARSMPDPSRIAPVVYCLFGALKNSDSCCPITTASSTSSR